MRKLKKLRWSKLFAMVLLPILLVACKTELYKGLTQSDANEMLALLIRADIAAEKVFDKKGDTVSLLVAESDLAEAIELLRKKGLPREKFTNPAQIFKDDGLISSPMQENARYVYALSQDLAETLSQLDGVLTARVHLVLQDKFAKKKDVKNASAGVLIRYAKGAEIQKFTPQIKMLIMNSVEGIAYDNISVAFFPGKDAAAESSELTAQPAPGAVPQPTPSSTVGTPQFGDLSAQNLGQTLLDHKLLVLAALGLLLVAFGGFKLLRSAPKPSLAKGKHDSRRQVGATADARDRLGTKKSPPPGLPKIPGTSVAGNSGQQDDQSVV